MKMNKFNMFITAVCVLFLINFIMFFTHCNVHDLECNVHDSVLLSNKEDTQCKRNIYQFIICVAIYLKNNIIGFKLSLQNSQEFRVEDLYLGTWFLQL